MEKDSRWNDPSSFSIHWNSRTELISTLIPAESSVIEFGVGLCPISNYIEISKYTATDFIERDSLSTIYDLNDSNLADFQNHDIAVFSGVLEYIHDLPTKIKFVSDRVNSIVCSYCTLENYPTDREIREWVNSYTDSDFIKLFESFNLKLSLKTNWKNQTIYVFNKN